MPDIPIKTHPQDYTARNLRYRKAGVLSTPALSLVHNMMQEPAMRRDGCRRNRKNFYSCDAMRRRSDKTTPDTGTLLKSDGRAQCRTCDASRALASYCELGFTASFIMAYRRRHCSRSVTLMIYITVTGVIFT